MPTNPQYAIFFAANAYAESTNVVNPANAIPPPAGWAVVGGKDLTETGFLARAYKNTTLGTNEIVIAFAGTTSENGEDWFNGNFPGAAGDRLAPQIVDAAKFYLDVIAANPTATITFTGHSLGGGIASLMGVFFNKPAYSFDQAPFARSANSAVVVNGLKKELLRLNYALPRISPPTSPARLSPSAAAW